MPNTAWMIRNWRLYSSETYDRKTSIKWLLLICLYTHTLVLNPIIFKEATKSSWWKHMLNPQLNVSRRENPNWRSSLGSSLWRLRNPGERGRKKCRSQTVQGYQENTVHQRKVSMACRSPQRLKQQSINIHGSALGPVLHNMVHSLVFLWDPYQW